MATLIAGSRFGYALTRAIVLDVIVGIGLAQAAERRHLATGSSTARLR